MKRADRSADTDIMRIICSFCVVLLHTASCNRAAAELSPQITGTVNALCRFSVPVFVIISGKYMIAKDYGIIALLKKCLKLLSEMVLTSAVYMAFDCLVWGIIPQDVKSVAQALLTSPIHLWYIYAVVILYLFTPLLKLFAQNATQKELFYIIALCFFFGSILYIPLNAAGFSVLKAVIEKCHIDCTLTFAGCYMLGYYISNFKLGNKSKLLIYLCGILGAAVSVIIQNSSVFTAEIKNLSLSLFAPNIVIQSIGFYVCTTDILTGKAMPKLKNKKIITLLSKSTYFVYLWHVLVLNLITNCNWGTVNILYIFIVSILTYTVCVCVNTILLSVKNQLQHAHLRSKTHP